MQHVVDARSGIAATRGFAVEFERLSLTDRADVPKAEACYSLDHREVRRNVGQDDRVRADLGQFRESGCMQVITVPVRNPQMGGSCGELRRLGIVVAEPPTARKGRALQPGVEEHAQAAHLDEERCMVEIMKANGRHGELLSRWCWLGGRSRGGLG